MSTVAVTEAPQQPTEANKAESQMISEDQARALELELAWVAGIFDVGGYLEAKNRTEYLRVSFPFGPAKAKRFQQALKAGKLYGPYNLKGRLVWQYELTGRSKISGALNLFAPYLTDPNSIPIRQKKHGSTP